jgi:hypothetical protein
MKIKLLNVTAMLLLFSFAAVAQHGQIRAGVNLANVSVTSGGRVDQSNQLTTFQVGVLKDFALVPNFLSLQPGLLYSSKGAEVQRGTAGQTGYYRQTFNPRYIEVPVNLLVKAPIGRTARLFAGAGPYAAMGVGGRVTTERNLPIVGSATAERSIRFSNDDPTTLNEEEGTGLGVVRRFDYGLNGLAGIETRNLVLGVNYGHGLAKLQSGTNNNVDNNNKHRVLSFTLGFKF